MVYDWASTEQTLTSNFLEACWDWIHIHESQSIVCLSGYWLCLFSSFVHSGGSFLPLFSLLINPGTTAYLGGIFSFLLF